MECVIIEQSEELMRETSSLCRESGLPVAAEFTDALEGLEYLQSHSVDLALISWCMTGIDGPMLGKLVKKLVPQTRVIYLSDEAVEAEEVYETEAFGYLRRPADTKKLRHYVSLAERASRRSAPSAAKPEPPVIERKEMEREVVIRTFGHFDVYVDSKPLFFPNRRAKEMLAMLVDCQGAVMTREHFLERFWPDSPVTEQRKSIYRKASSVLQQTLARSGVSYILFSNRRQKALNTAAVWCDYYEFLNGDAAALDSYRGEYMIDYTWAEATNGRLWQMSGYWEEEENTTKWE